jgi:hypothetical protein
MRLSRDGMAAGLLSVPPRYMQTPNEPLLLEDLENSAAHENSSFLFSSSYALKCSFHFA